ncbi:MAG: T9SS type A sorting domain-containing protein, partial [Bacteroidota bacterium]
EIENEADSPITTTVNTEDIGSNTRTPIVHPNPTTNQIFIQSALPIEKVEVFNAFGQLVCQSSYTATVELSDLPSAYYLIKVQQERGAYSLHKVLKK